MLVMSKRDFSRANPYFAMKLRIFMAFLIMSLTAARADFAQLGYGSRINAVHAVNSEGKDVIIPPEGVVSILFFFDINSPPHINILNSLNFLLINLDQGGKVKLFAISKGEGKTFENIRSKYNLIFDLINDQQELIITHFNYNCAGCVQFVLLDKERLLRYLSSNFDPVFLREVIQRYIE